MLENKMAVIKKEKKTTYQVRRIATTPVCVWERNTASHAWHFMMGEESGLLGYDGCVCVYGEEMHQSSLLFFC